MKLNIPVRIHNPWFWVSLTGVILGTMGISPEMLTSWEALFQAAVDLVKNPFMLGCVIVAVLGVFIDPTTEGISDSERALTYVKPGVPKTKEASEDKAK